MKVTSPLPTNIHLTPKAHRGLHELGYETNFSLEPNSRRLAKLVHLWADVEQAWLDNRPAHIRASDAIADTYNHARQWWSGEYAGPLCVGALPILYLLRVAEQHGIRPLAHQRVMTVGHDLTRPRAKLRVSDLARASAVLEAIGSRWLVPLTPLPENPARVQDRRRRASLYG